jgi:hypothetical protein
LEIPPERGRGYGQIYVAKGIFLSSWAFVNTDRMCPGRGTGEKMTSLQPWGSVMEILEKHIITMSYR